MNKKSSTVIPNRIARLTARLMHRYASAVKHSLPKFTHSMLLPEYTFTNQPAASNISSPSSINPGDEDYSSDEENDSAEKSAHHLDSSQCGPEFLVDVSASELTAEQRAGWCLEWTYFL